MSSSKRVSILTVVGLIALSLGVYQLQEKNEALAEDAKFGLQTLIVETTDGEKLDDYDGVKDVKRVSDDTYVVDLDSASDTSKVYKELRKQDDVQTVATDTKLKALDDTVVAQGGSGRYQAWGVSVIGADLYTNWLNSKTNLSEVTVAVLDSGINANHEVFANTTTGDRIDLTYAHNYESNSNDLTDDNGHGTIVAGLIAESTPAVIKILPLKVLDNEGNGRLSNVVTAIYDACLHASIINLSLGVNPSELGQAAMQVFENALKTASDQGILLVAAAGNSRQGKVFYPASSQYAVAVSSVDYNMNFSETFSNYGDEIMFAMPGQHLSVPRYTGVSDYSLASGTSLSTPFLAAAGALIKATYPSYNANKIIAAFQEDAIDLGETGRDKYFGYGMVRLNNRVENLIKETNNSTETDDDNGNGNEKNENENGNGNKNGNQNGNENNQNENENGNGNDSNNENNNENENSNENNNESSNENGNGNNNENNNENGNENNGNENGNENQNGNENTNNNESASIQDGIYIIHSALNDRRVLDISGGSNEDGANLQLYTNNSTAAQKFIIRKVANSDLYEIENLKSRKVLDVKYKGMTDYTNIWQYTGNQTCAQRWYIKKTNDFYNFISNCSDLYMDVADSGAADGTNVLLYHQSNAMSQNFTLQLVENLTDSRTLSNGVYIITSSLSDNKALDISGGSIASGANLQLYTSNDTTAQKFRIAHLQDGFYEIVNTKSLKALDVSGANSNAGTNVWQYDRNGTAAQQWLIKQLPSGEYAIISRCNLMYLDVSGASIIDGTNVQIWDGNGTKAQRFKLAFTR